MNVRRLLGALGVAAGLAVIVAVIGAGCSEGPVTGPGDTADADAGPDTTVAVRSLVRLDASRSSPGSGTDAEIVSYRWTIVNKPAGSDAEMSYNYAYSFGYFTPDSLGTYRVLLSIKDNYEVGDTDYVYVTAVDGGVPLADAGEDQEVDVGAPAILDGSGSTDLDGDPLTYSWSSLGPTRMTIMDPDTVHAAFTLDRPGVAEVELTVSDGTNEHKDVVQISSRPPTITSVDPLWGSIGTEITIQGTNFSPVAAQNIVTVGGAEAAVLSASATEIAAVVPEGPYPDQTMTIKVRTTGITHGPDTAIGPEFGIADWVQIASPGTYNFNDVDFFGVTFGVAVGSVGQINITDNISQPFEDSESGTTEELRGVCVTGAGMAFAVGAGGTILRTLDYGDTWTSQPSGTWEYFWAVDFFDAAHGMAVGMDATIAVTSDSGTTWTATWRVNGLRDPLLAVEMLDENTAIATGNGIMFRTTDGGQTWQTQALINGSAGMGICYTDPTTGTIVGDNGSVIRTISGAPWVDVSVDALTQLYDVSFYDTDTGVVAGGGIYRTTNGGTEWHQEYSGNWTVHGVHMVSSEVGFAVGESGAILKRTAGQ
jgi:photosystem II stability/assembly factor-like uncharacterized protein